MVSFAFESEVVQSKSSPVVLDSWVDASGREMKGARHATRSRVIRRRLGNGLDCGGSGAEWDLGSFSG